MYPKRQRKRKKIQSLEEMVDAFSQELDANDKAKRLSSQKKKDVIVRFERDKSGNRVTHTKYRERSGLTKKSLGPGLCTSASKDESPPDDDNPSFGLLDELSCEEELEHMLKDVDELLLDWKGKKSKSWSSRMELLNAKWEDHRSDIMEYVLTYVGFHAEKCSRCMSVGSDALIRCHQCGPGNLCSMCDELVHSKLPLHDREIFDDGYYRPVPPSESIFPDGSAKPVRRHLLPCHIKTCPLCDNNENLCERFEDEKCVVITLRGRFDIEIGHLVCLNCNLTLSKWDIKTVISMGYWPATPNNLTTVFDQEVFEFWDILQKLSPGVSQRSFLMSLQEFSLNKGRGGVVNATSFNRAFKEWKFCKFELEKLAGKNWMECPPCSVYQHSGHVDGNSKLYRFMSAGRRQRECYYGETFIASSNKVEEHCKQLQSLGFSGKQDQSREESNCGESSWKAGMNAERRRRNLDETGLEILGCRHSIAQKAISMHRGEIYSYAHFLQTNYLIPKGAQYFWYDVVCMYWPWLIKNKSDAAEKMKPALSVMHAKAHSWSCQVLWGGRWQLGAAGTSGEEVEQINSHFSRLGNTTKHISEGREELLTEHALTWNQRKIRKMAWFLTRRYAKTKEKLHQSLLERESLLESIGCQESYNADKWMEDIRNIAKEENNMQRGKTSMTAIEELFIVSLMCSALPLSPEYAVLVRCVAAFFPRRYSYMEKNKNSDVFAKRARTLIIDENQSVSGSGEESVKNLIIDLLRRNIQTRHFNIVQIAFNMGKLADSSKKRKRLRRKIQSQKNEINQFLKDYNELTAESISAEDAENGTFPWLIDGDKHSVPIKHKRQVTDVEMEVRRAKEEITLIEQEMINFITFYKRTVLVKLQDQQTLLENNLKELDQDTSSKNSCGVSRENKLMYSSSLNTENVIKGKMSLTRLGINFCYQQLYSALTMFRQVKECDEERLEDQLSQLAEELGEEISDDVVDESEDESDDDDVFENNDSS